MIDSLYTHKSKIALLGSILGLAGIAFTVGNPLLTAGAALHTVYRFLALE